MTNEQENQIEKMSYDLVNIDIEADNGTSCRMNFEQATTVACELVAKGFRKESDVVAEVVTGIKDFITSEIAKREYHTEIEIKTQAKTLNRVWAMLDKIEKSAPHDDVIDTITYGEKATNNKENNNGKF